MEFDEIQEQFNNYLQLLEKMHVLGHDIDASINETEIRDIEEKRAIHKARMRITYKNLIAALKTKGNKYRVYNTLAQQYTLLSVIDGKLVYENE